MASVRVIRPAVKKVEWVHIVHSSRRQITQTHPSHPCPSPLPHNPPHHPYSSPTLHSKRNRIPATPSRQLVPLPPPSPSQRINGPLLLLPRYIRPSIYPQRSSHNPLLASYAFDTKGLLTRERISNSSRYALSPLLSLLESHPPFYLITCHARHFICPIYTIFPYILLRPSMSFHLEKENPSMRSGQAFRHPRTLAESLSFGAS